MPSIQARSSRSLVAAHQRSQRGDEDRARLYLDGTCLSEDLPDTDISAHLADPASVLWLDLCRPTKLEHHLNVSCHVASKRDWRVDADTNVDCQVCLRRLAEEYDRRTPRCRRGVARSGVS